MNTPVGLHAGWNLNVRRPSRTDRLTGDEDRHGQITGRKFQAGAGEVE